MLRFCSILFLGMMLAACAFAAPHRHAYRISFSDKLGAPELSQAHTWLSARSLARRAQFGIALNNTDRPISPLYLDTVLSLTGGKLHNKSRWLNQCVVLLPDTTSLSALRNKPWVKGIEWVGDIPLDFQEKPAANPKAEPSFPLFNYSTVRTSGSPSYYGATWAQTLLVHGDTLHDQGFLGQGKLIAVLDDGFIGVNTHSGFSAMRAEGRLLETYNFLQDTGYVFAYGGHGTECFSDIAGFLPGSFVGTAPEADYALYVTEDPTITDALYELDAMVAGIERADSIGADIISASLGYNIFVSPAFSFLKSELDGKTTIVAKAVNVAAAKGILYVASAGNEGGNTWDFLTTPADADSSLAVGAVNINRGAASFSSPGPNASGRVKPDVSLMGVGAAVLSPGGGVSANSGTSFSTPQAAGYAACLMQAFPTLPPHLIRETFARISDRYTAPTAKLGYGIPDFRMAQSYLAQFLPDTAGGPVQIVPNPFTTSLTVLVRQATTVRDIQMYDMAGRFIELQRERSGTVLGITPIRDMPAGVYIFRITVDGKRYIRKLLHL